MTEFLAFCRSYGLALDYIEADGRVHRCRTFDKPHKRNGAYSYDGRTGWCQNWATHDTATAYRPDGALALPKPRPLPAPVEPPIDARAAAWRILRECAPMKHPYLARKGFPDVPMLVAPDGRLAVPMMLVHNAVGVQFIDDKGEKLFMRGSQARGASFTIGAGQRRTWLCEGLATALSVRAALRSMYIDDQVRVCFSAGNLAPVAESLRTPAIVCADNDPADRTGRKAGEYFAARTGLVWTMPPIEGEDFNDMHLRAGLRAVCGALRLAMDSLREKATA